MLQALETSHIKHLTRIQEIAMARGALSGKSMLINAENGSGKTLAYLLSILNQLYTLRAPERGIKSALYTMDRSNENEMF